MSTTCWRKCSCHPSWQIWRQNAKDAKRVNSILCGGQINVYFREEPVFEELFAYACPKFINPASPPYAQIIEDPSKAQNYSQVSNFVILWILISFFRNQLNFNPNCSSMKFANKLISQPFEAFWNSTQPLEPKSLLTFWTWMPKHSELNYCATNIRQEDLCGTEEHLPVERFPHTLMLIFMLIKYALTINWLN